MLGGVSGWLRRPWAQLTASVEGRAGGWWPAGHSGHEGKTQSHAREMGSTPHLRSLSLPVCQKGSAPCLPSPPTTSHLLPPHIASLPTNRSSEKLEPWHQDHFQDFRLSLPTCFALYPKKSILVPRVTQPGPVAIPLSHACMSLRPPLWLWAQVRTGGHLCSCHSSPQPGTFSYAQLRERTDQGFHGGPVWWGGVAGPPVQQGSALPYLWAESASLPWQPAL